jgi:cysteine desulfurase
MFYCLFRGENSYDFNLDMKGIAVSRVVLARGSIRASHVLSEMLSDEDLRRPSLRIS